MVAERCCICDETTGRAGRADDSLWIDTPNGELGPLCAECFDALTPNQRLEEEIANWQEWFEEYRRLDERVKELEREKAAWERRRRDL